MKNNDIEETFVHLACVSDYSMLQSTLKYTKIVDLAVKHKMPAVGLCDKFVLSGCLEFSNYARSKGIQPIIGQIILLKLQDGVYFASRLYVRSKVGWNNLLELSYLSYKNSLKEKKNEPFISLQQLSQFAEGLSVVVSNLDISKLGSLYDKVKKNIANELFPILKKHFADYFYLGLCLGDINQNDFNFVAKFIELAEKFDVPLVAINEITYPNKEDNGSREAYEAVVSIGKGNNFSQIENNLFYGRPFYDASTCRKLYSSFQEAIDNTLVFSTQCLFFPENSAPQLPKYHRNDHGKDKEISENKETENQILERHLKESFEKLIKQGLIDENKKQEYQKRIDYEYQVITDMQFAGYFLVVEHFVKWTKKQGYPVGPGRGSATGSLISFVLSITNVDPLKYGLLFERFLNPGRKSMPDIDIDFCQANREKTISFVKEYYGDKQVAQIITYGTLKTKVALRDVARFLKISIDLIDKVCKFIPDNALNPMSLKDAFEINDVRIALETIDEESASKLKTICLQVEGLIRHSSTHASGVVIADKPINKMIPVMIEPNSQQLLTQYNMKIAEAAGLVKFDFLGLKTLTIIRNCLDSVEKNYGKKINIDIVDLDDKKVYEMLSNGGSVGVFQMESAGMIETLKQMKPDCIDDLIALVALYRPGPMEMIPSYCNRKHGQEKINYITPELSSILDETQGVILYQEQVMKIARDLAGYNLSEADNFRRAIGKKDKEEMARQKKKFIEGVVNKGVSETKAKKLFSLIDKFANYGFPKPHATAYGIIGYQTAYLKCHYPCEFLSALMNLELDNTDQIRTYVSDLKLLNLKLKAPSVKAPTIYFLPKGSTITYAFSALKGMGKNVASHIDEVVCNNEISSLKDFFNSLDPKKINKRGVEALIFSGALDCFGYPRGQLFNSLDFILKQVGADASQNFSLFDEISGVDSSEIELSPDPKWSLFESAQKELEAFGFYFSKHPMDDFKVYRKVKKYCSIAEQLIALEDNKKSGFFNDKNRLSFKVVATVISKKRLRSKTKKGYYTNLRISDETGDLIIQVFDEELGSKISEMHAGQTSIFLVAARFNSETETFSFLLSGIKEISGTKIATYLVINYKKLNGYGVLEKEMDILSKHIEKHVKKDVSADVKQALHDKTYCPLLNLHVKASFDFHGNVYELDLVNYRDLKPEDFDLKFENALLQDSDFVDNVKISNMNF